ncbi:MAG: hypothetical protein ACOYVF_03685 [Candidatus Zixiibacteriota bacterium]
MEIKGRFLQNLINCLSRKYRLLVLAALTVQTISLFIISFLTFDYLVKGSDSVLYSSGILLFPVLGAVFILSLGVNLLSIFTVSGVDKPDASQLNKTGALPRDMTDNFNNPERPFLFERELKNLAENASSRQILQLFRNAERLDMVEKDLIRRLVDNHLTDPKTELLLSEVQICTCRLIKQLADFHLNNQTETAVNDDFSRLEIPVR